jgi:hypothetical protein
MGDPIYSVFSEVFLQYMENEEIYDILRNAKLEGYFRYVDDILIIYKENHTDINEVLSSFNSISPGLNFTAGQDQNNRINFLDLTIQKRCKQVNC